MLQLVDERLVNNLLLTKLVSWPFTPIFILYNNYLYTYIIPFPLPQILLFIYFCLFSFGTNC